MRRPPVITIDGPAGVGKSTASRALAARLGFTYLDTGAIYRAVAHAVSADADLANRLDRSEGLADLSLADQEALGAIARGLRISFGDGGERVMVDDKDVSTAIRTPEMSQRASRVSAVPAVRAGLLELQRRLGERGGVVAEGRDMGTVVFPDAEVKFFFEADASCRARRRSLELAAQGREVDEEATRREIELRDARDSGRAIAPLRRPSGAVTIDTGPLTPGEVVERMLQVVSSRPGS
jgi:cytidylate kinase